MKRFPAASLAMAGHPESRPESPSVPRRVTFAFLIGLGSSSNQFTTVSRYPSPGAMSARTACAVYRRPRSAPKNAVVSRGRAGLGLGDGRLDREGLAAARVPGVLTGEHVDPGLLPAPVQARLRDRQDLRVLELRTPAEPELVRGDVDALPVEAQ